MARHPRRGWSLAAAAAALLAGCGADDEGESAVTVTTTVTVAAGELPASTERGDAAKPDAAGCTRIVVDPGHDSQANPGVEPIAPDAAETKVKDGGGTSGAATGTPEHEVNLEISQKLRDQLEDRGYCVKMTRERATGLSMGNVERARIANRAEAALFVRVHADGSTDASRAGSFVLYPAPRAGATDDILPESQQAAELVQQSLVRALDSSDLGIVERRDITGFNWADVPSILVEVGYLTNPAEDRRLNDPDYQGRAAEGIADGIEAFAPPAGQGG